MMAALLWLAALAVLLATERSFRGIPFAIAAFALLTAIWMLVTGDLGQAALLALVVALLAAGASLVKHHHSGMKLAAGDIALATAGTIPFMIRQYRRTAAITLVSGALLILFGALVLLLLHTGIVGGPLRLAALVVTGIATVALYRLAGGVRYRLDVTRPARFFSFFAASLVDLSSWWPSRGLRMLDVGDRPLPLAAALPARSPMRPDIIVIQHESVFDPRFYGLPVEPAIAEFLSPAGAMSGGLHVDIYGGGSWQTEFSTLTGLSSASFGPDSYFLFRKGVGRFAHSLPSELSALGYKTMLSTSCRENFLNYNGFYAGLGVEERWFSDTFPPPFNVVAFEGNNSDKTFFAATEGVLTRSIDADPAPRFLMALTNFNHGPHEVRGVPEGAHEDARAFATAALAEPTYAEYYARLTETAESYAAFKAALAAHYPGRPMLFVRYGDHQPTLTRTLEAKLRLPPDDQRLFRTFYAIEAVNFGLQPVAMPEVLDIAFLGTASLAASGLPLDAVSATRLSLMQALSPAYFAAHSAAKTAFHRTLVDHGLIDFGPRHASAVARGGKPLENPSEP